MKTIILGLILTTWAICSFAQNEIEQGSVLHFLRERDIGILNQMAKISINDQLRLGLTINSYDTLHVDLGASIEVRTKKNSLNIDITEKRNFYFLVNFKSSIFIIAGKFELIEVDENFFLTKINSRDFNKGRKPK